MISTEEYNGEHYEDKTAGQAVANADADMLARRVIVEVLRYLKGHGFELQNRLHILHRKTGREYQ